MSRFPVEEGHALLQRFWPALTKHVPAEELPVGPDAEQLGCGMYGCVWATVRPDLVVKLTTDQDEVAFVGAALTLPPQAGIVRYSRALQLGGSTVRRRQAFLLWRERVAEVGISRLEARLTFDLLGSFKVRAQLVREAMHELPREDAARVFPLWASPEDPKDRVWAVQQAAEELRELWSLAQEMQAESGGLREVGATLQAYVREGILLADVHHENVGRAYRGGPLVITDPGQAVFLDERWATVTIPLLPDKAVKAASDLDALTSVITERVRYMAHNQWTVVTSKRTGATSFRVDHLVKGRLQGRLEVKVTPKLVTVEAASMSWGSSRVIFEEAFSSLAGQAAFGGRKVRVTHVDLDAAVDS